MPLACFSATQLRATVMQHLSHLKPVGAAFEERPPDAMPCDATAAPSGRQASSKKRQATGSRGGSRRGRGRSRVRLEQREESDRDEREAGSSDDGAGG